MRWFVRARRNTAIRDREPERRLREVQKSKEIQDILARYGFTSLGTFAAEFSSYIAKERERWIKVVRASGVLLEY